MRASRTLDTRAAAVALVIAALVPLTAAAAPPVRVFVEPGIIVSVPFPATVKPTTLPVPPLTT